MIGPFGVGCAIGSKEIIMVPVNSSRWLVWLSRLFLEGVVMIPVRVVLRSG